MAAEPTLKKTTPALRKDTGTQPKPTQPASKTRHVHLQVRSDLVRNDSLDDREYVVAPVVPIVEGVLNGEFVPYEEIAIFPEAWSGRPVPVSHPPQRAGDGWSASTPANLRDFSIGLFLNVVDRPDLRGISGEIWIDIDKANNVDGGQEVLERVQNGGQLEVSTAYFCFVDDESGEFDGIQYNGRQRDIRPDHLAVLPFDIGACNWEMGCGAPRVNQKEVENVRRSSRRPTYTGTETTPWKGVSKSFNSYAKGYLRSIGSDDIVPSSVEAATPAMKRWIAARTLLGEPGAENDRDLLFFPVVNPRTGKLNKGALQAVLDGRASQGRGSRAAIESAQAMARRLLKSQYGVTTETGNMSEKIKVNGQLLGQVLSGMIQASADEGSDEDSIVERLAAAAGITTDKLQAIANGDIDFVPRQWLHIFSAVLGTDAADLFISADADTADTRRAPSVFQSLSEDVRAEVVAYVKSLPDNKPSADDQASDTDKTNAGEHQECEPCKKSFMSRVQDVINQTLQAVRETEPAKESNSKEDTNMPTKEERIAALISNEATRFSDDDREFLESLDESKLERLEPVAVTANADADAGKDKGEVAESAEKVDNAGADADAAKAENADDKAEAAKPELTKEAVLAALGISEEHLAIVQANADQKKSDRANAITEILEFDDNPYSKEDLEKMSDQALEKTHALLKPEDAPTGFIARGAANASDDNGVPASPAILLAGPDKK